MYPLASSINWTFHTELEWNLWMLNVFSKAAVMTAILRYTVNLSYKVHENIEDNSEMSNMIVDISESARQQRIRFAQQATAVAIYLAPRFWRGGFYLSKNFDRLAAEILALDNRDGGFAPYVTRTTDNRWIFKKDKFTDSVGAERAMILLRHLIENDAAFNLCRPPSRHAEWNQMSSQRRDGKSMIKFCETERGGALLNYALDSKRLITLTAA